MKFSRLALMVVITSAAWSQTTDTQASQDQPGPTILSRADMQLPPDAVTENRSGNYANYFLFARGLYSTNLGNFDSNGTAQGYQSYGGFDVGGGVNLAHGFERGMLSLAYTGGYRDYTQGNQSSMYQNLAVSLNYKLSRRWLMALRESIQILPQGQVATPLYVGDGTALGFNAAASRQQFYITSASMIYQQTMRLSYEFGGDFFYSSYHPDSYFNSRGFGASASVNYRQTSRTTIGLGYTYNRFFFSGGVGESNTNTAFASLSHTFSPTLQFGLSAGGSRTEFSQLIVLADNLGSYTYQRTSYSPFVNAKLTKSAKRYTASATFVNGVNAGNGAFATSKSLNAGAGIGYSFSRNLAFSGAVGYSRLSSIAGPTLNLTGNYGYFYLTGNATYKLTRHIGTNFSISYSDSQGATSTPSVFTLACGLVFTSEDRPVLSF